MRFLIDTHVFLWFINGDARLPQTMRTVIEDEENEVLLIDKLFKHHTKVRIIMEVK